MMKKKLLTLTILLFSKLAFGQKSNDYLVAYTDSTSGKELTGYKSVDGKIIIKAKYQSGSDTLKKMAIVLNSEFEFVGIDRKDSILLKPYIYDNGPDYVEEGLFRFVENKKIGFANLDGQKIIAAKYDFATPFENGIAAYYLGGERIYENNETEKQIINQNGFEGLIDRHWSWGGNITESGYINKAGQEFVKVTELKNNKREVWTKNRKHLLINNKGQILKTYSK